MSVLMTMRTNGDPKKLEELMAADPQAGLAISESGKSHGVIAHRFYGDDDGHVMVVDEWPDRESFQRFFEENQSRIQPLIEAVGGHGAPEVMFWRELDTPDKVGWEQQSG